MDRKKMVYVGAAALLVVLILWAIYTVPQIPTDSKNQEGPRTMSYQGNVITEEKDGRVIWQLTSDSIEVDVDTQDTSMHPVQGIFYSDDGRTLELTADEGRMERASGDIILSGSVRVTMSDGGSLTSSKLLWNAKESELAAEEDFALTRADIRATGDRISTKDEFQQFRIAGHAHIEKGRE